MDLHCPKPTKPTHAGNNSRQKKVERFPAQVRFGGEELGWRSGCVPLAAGTAHYRAGETEDGASQFGSPFPVPIPPLEELLRGTVGAGSACTARWRLEITGELQESSPAVQISLIARTLALEKAVQMKFKMFKMKLFADILVEMTHFLHIPILKLCRVFFCGPYQVVLQRQLEWVEIYT